MSADHMHIARERFLDLMAGNRSADPKAAAIMAIDQADKFMAAYVQYGPKNDAPAAAKLKGCKACHGSGGKRNDPCKVCGGTGKVPA